MAGREGCGRGEGEGGKARERRGRDESVGFRARANAGEVTNRKAQKAAELPLARVQRMGGKGGLQNTEKTIHIGESGVIGMKRRIEWAGEAFGLKCTIVAVAGERQSSVRDE